ncbi:hypothetical protein Tco_1200344 [Tanacetum coccineum]
MFLPKEGPRSRLAGVVWPNIAQPLHGVKLLGGHASVDFDFSSELVMKIVAKTVELVDEIAKINGPKPTFDDAMCACYAKIEIDLLSNPSEISSSKLIASQIHVTTSKYQRDDVNISLDDVKVADSEEAQEDYTDMFWGTLAFASGIRLSWIKWKESKTSKALRRYIIGCSKMFLTILFQMKDVFCDRPSGLPVGMHGLPPDFYKKLGGSVWEAACLRYGNDGPMSS